MARMLFRINRLGAPAAVLTAGLLAACGAPSDAPPASPASSSTDEVQITGRERLGWTQIAEATDHLHFAVYVDDRTRVELSAACTRIASDAHSCESPLPPLSAGRHSLELVAWVDSSRGPYESARAAAVIVQVTSGPAATEQATAAASQGAGAPFSTPREAAAPPGCGVVATANRELMLWDSSGSIRTIDPESQRLRTVAWRGADSEHDGDRWVLSGVASHPDFAKNGWTYVAEMSRDQEPLLRVVRYRKKGDVLGERAVLFQQTLTKPPFRIRLSAARGNRPYVALLAGPAETAAGSPGTHPFLIRLTADGRVPADNDAGSVFAAAVATRPIDVAWPDDGGLPWVIEQIGSNRYTLVAGGGSRRSSSFSTTSPPIAARFSASGGQTTLWVALSQGDLLRFHDSVVGWVLSPEGPQPVARRAARDAALVDAEEMAFCGPSGTSADTDPPGFGLWRRRLRN